MDKQELIEEIELAYNNYVSILKDLPKECGELIWVKPSEINPTEIEDMEEDNPISETIKRDNYYLKNEKSLNGLYNSLIQNGMYFPFFVGKGKPQHFGLRNGYEKGKEWFVDEGHHRLICLRTAEERKEFDKYVLAIYHKYGFSYITKDLNGYVRDVAFRKTSNIKIKYLINSFFHTPYGKGIIRDDGFKSGVINHSEDIKKLNDKFIEITLTHGLDVHGLLFRLARYLQYLFHCYTNLTGEEYKPKDEISIPGHTFPIITKEEYLRGK